MKSLLANRYKIIAFSIGLTQALCVASVNAETASQKADEQPSIKAIEPFDATRDVISYQVVRFADWIDTFFAGERAYDELQESHVKIYVLQTHFEHDKPLYETKVKAKLTFPKTQKRLKLLIESEDDDEEDEQAQQESIVKAAEKTDQSIGLRLIQTESDEWRIHTDALLRFRSGVETVARLRISRRKVRGSWINRLSENITWNSKDGLKETTRLTFDHTMTNDWLFRSTTHATWKNINGYFNYGHDFLLFQNISKRRALTYQTGIRAITEQKPRTTNYFLSMRYREQIHKGWVFYEIIPAINYPIEANHNPVRSISLKLEVVFDDN